MTRKLERDGAENERESGIARRLASYCAAAGAIGLAGAGAADGATIYSGLKNLPIDPAGAAIDIDGDNVIDFTISREFRTVNGTWGYVSVRANAQTQNAARPNNAFYAGTFFGWGPGRQMEANGGVYYAAATVHTSQYPALLDSPGRPVTGSDRAVFAMASGYASNPTAGSGPYFAGAWAPAGWGTTSGPAVTKIALFKFSSQGTTPTIGAMRIQVGGPADNWNDMFAGSKVIDWIWYQPDAVNDPASFHVEFAELAATVPEPSSLGLLAAGAAGVAALRRRRRRPA